MSNRNAIDWADLPTQILDLVTDQLDQQNLIAASSVCTSWRRHLLNSPTAFSKLQVKGVNSLNNEDKLGSFYRFIESRRQSVEHLQLYLVYERQSTDNILSSTLSLCKDSLISLDIGITKYTKNRRGMPGPLTFNTLTSTEQLHALQSLSLHLFWDSDMSTATHWLSQLAPTLQTLEFVSYNNRAHQLDLRTLPSLQHIKLHRKYEYDAMYLSINVLPIALKRLDINYGLNIRDDRRLVSGADLYSSENAYLMYDCEEIDKFPNLTSLSYEEYKFEYSTMDEEDSYLMINRREMFTTMLQKLKEFRGNIDYSLQELFFSSSYVDPAEYNCFENVEVFHYVQSRCIMNNFYSTMKHVKEVHDIIQLCNDDDYLYVNDHNDDFYFDMDVCEFDDEPTTISSKISFIPTGDVLNTTLERLVVFRPPLGRKCMEFNRLLTDSHENTSSACLRTTYPSLKEVCFLGSLQHVIPGSTDTVVHFNGAVHGRQCYIPTYIDSAGIATCHDNVINWLLNHCPSLERVAFALHREEHRMFAERLLEKMGGEKKFEIVSVEDIIGDDSPWWPQYKAHMKKWCRLK